MSESTPRVTVLMPAYNAAAFLQPAIESIVGQTFRDFELLLIDDGSTDGTQEMVRSFRDARIRLLVNDRNLGLIHTLNRGLNEARGEFLARLDADDVARPRRLEKQVAFLENHSEVVLLGTLAEQIDERGRALGSIDLPLDSLSIHWSLFFDNCFVHSAVIFRTRVVREVFGGYDPTAVGSEDFELWSRIARQFPVANLGERLIQLRTHSSSIMRANQALVEAGSRRNLRANLSAGFPERPLREDELALLAQFRGTVEPARLADFHTLFEELRARFSATHAEACESHAWRRTVAMQFARIAYNLLPHHRTAALGEYRRCLRVWPRAVTELPWLHILALALLGNYARELYRRFAPAPR